MPCWARSRLTQMRSPGTQVGRVAGRVELLAGPGPGGQVDGRLALDPEAAPAAVGQGGPAHVGGGCRSPAGRGTASGAPRPWPRTGRPGPPGRCRRRPRPGPRPNHSTRRSPAGTRHAQPDPGQRAGPLPLGHDLDAPAAARRRRPSTGRWRPPPGRWPAGATRVRTTRRVRPRPRPRRPGAAAGPARPAATAAPAPRPWCPRSLSVGARHRSSRGPSTAQVAEPQQPPGGRVEASRARAPGGCGQPGAAPCPARAALPHRGTWPGTGWVRRGSGVGPVGRPGPVGGDGQLAPGDLVAGRGPGLVGGQDGPDGQPGLAVRWAAGRAGRRWRSRPGPTGRDLERGRRRPATPSSSRDHSKARWERSRKSCRLATRMPPSGSPGDADRLDHLLELEQARATASGPGTAGRRRRSCRRAAARRSRRRRRRTRAPSAVRARRPWSIHSQTKPPWQRGWRSNSSWYSAEAAGAVAHGVARTRRG